jgi:hypothetical protein
VSSKQKLEKFKHAPSTPLKKRPNIPRSSSFSDLRTLTAKKEASQVPQRRTSLPSRLELEEPAKLPLHKMKPRSKVNKLDAISEEDEAGFDIATSLQRRGETPTTYAETTARVGRSRLQIKTRRTREDPTSIVDRLILMIFLTYQFARHIGARLRTRHAR